MLRKILIPGLALLLVIIGVGLKLVKTETTVSGDTKWNEETPLAEVLESLGHELKNVRPDKIDEEKARMGEELITQGWTIGPDGKKTKRQSRYYVCTNCHNLQREDPSLAQSDPDKRLEYVMKKGMPLLQGTTFFGQINRESWYNGDYDKKYGELVQPARESLDGALHLCATVCSQGRDFEEWEMEAVKEYLWTLEYKLGDLELTPQDYKSLNKLAGKQDEEGIKWLKSKYLDYSPAKFVESPENHIEGYAGIQGDAERGKVIYSKACLACHDHDGPSEYLKLDHSSLSLGMLRRNIGKYSRFDLYQVIRHGTAPFAGHKPYMPHYTAHRMSDQQVEDIRAYLEEG